MRAYKAKGTPVLKLSQKGSLFRVLEIREMMSKAQLLMLPFMANSW